MIARRTFSLGLGAMSLMGPAPIPVAWADETMAGQKKKKKPRKDVPDTPLEQIPNHRQLMRNLIIDISHYAKGRRADFAVFARNAPELLVKEYREWDLQSAQDTDGAAAGKYTPVGTVDTTYLTALDGILFDGLFYGHDAVDQPTDPDDTQALLAEAQAARRQNRRLFTIEYCRSAKAQAAVVKQAAPLAAVVFIDTDPKRSLGAASALPMAENSGHINGLADVKNFLPLFENGDFSSHANWVAALGATNHDLLMLNAFWRKTSPLSKDEVTALKFKRLGTNRLVYALLPLGRADAGSHYWKPEWRIGAPKWLDSPDPSAPDRYIVQYWDPAWKEIVGSYIAGLMELGFDGVILDSLDSYLHFEEMTPI